MNTLPYKIESTGKKSAARAGWAAVAELLGHLGFAVVADRMPVPGQWHSDKRRRFLADASF